ncbi:unnamed protein product [Urochloa humidicola]
MVRFIQINAPLSPPFALSIHLLCHHRHIFFCFLRHAPRECRTTTCHSHTSAQIHRASFAPNTPPLLPGTTTTTTFASSILASPLPGCLVLAFVACGFDVFAPLVNVFLMFAETFVAALLSLAALSGDKAMAGMAAVVFLRRRRHPGSLRRRVWSLTRAVLPSIQFGGRYLPSVWAPQGLKVLSSGGCWRVVIKSRWFLCCAMHIFLFPSVGSFKMEQGTRYNLLILCVLFGNKYGSGNAPLNVRADLRSWSMLVLRFNIDKSRANFLSPVKHIQYLRLKIPNPRRHRPVRQPREALAVLSECNMEDPDVSGVAVSRPSAPVGDITYACSIKNAEIGCLDFQVPTSLSVSFRVICLTQL